MVEIVCNRFFLEPQDGQKVYAVIESVLSQGRSVQLAFLYMDLVTPVFLNRAIGQLYGRFPSDFLKAQLSVIHISGADMATLKQVVEAAKQYFVVQTTG